MKSISLLNSDVTVYSNIYHFPFERAIMGKDYLSILLDYVSSNQNEGLLFGILNYLKTKGINIKDLPICTRFVAFRFVFHPDFDKIVKDRVALSIEDLFDSNLFVCNKTPVINKYIIRLYNIWRGYITFEERDKKYISSVYPYLDRIIKISPPEFVEWIKEMKEKHNVKPNNGSTLAFKAAFEFNRQYETIVPWYVINMEDWFEMDINTPLQTLIEKYGYNVEKLKDLFNVEHLTPYDIAFLKAIKDNLPLRKIMEIVKQLHIPENLIKMAEEVASEFYSEDNIPELTFFSPSYSSDLSIELTFPQKKGWMQRDHAIYFYYALRRGYLLSYNNYDPIVKGEGFHDAEKQSVRKEFWEIITKEQDFIKNLKGRKNLYFYRFLKSYISSLNRQEIFELLKTFPNPIMFAIWANIPFIIIQNNEVDDEGTIIFYLSDTNNKDNIFKINYDSCSLIPDIITALIIEFLEGEIKEDLQTYTKRKLKGVPDSLFHSILKRLQNDLSYKLLD